MKPLANQDGMALLLVLVVVALLSALLTEFSFSTLVDLRATETFRDRTKAYYLARGGVEAARMILQEDKNINNYDHPSEFWGALPNIPAGDGDVNLKIRDLTGLFNLNEIADNRGNQQGGYHTFVALCEELGIDVGQAGDMGKSIVNWLNGVRTQVTDDDSYYAQQQPPYARKGANLETLDELNLVRHFDAEVIRSLRPYIRVGDKFPINLNTAPGEVLFAWQHSSAPGIAQISLEREDIEALVSYRGQTPFRELQDLASVPGIGSRWAGAWQPNSVAVKGELFEVSSTGRINQGSRLVKAVVQKTANKLVSLKVE